MTDLVYAVNGGFEDWAYGAWEKNNIFDKSNIKNNVLCDGIEPEEVKDRENISCLLYLLETAD